MTAHVAGQSKVLQLPTPAPTTSATTAQHAEPNALQSAQFGASRTRIHTTEAVLVTGITRLAGWQESAEAKE